MLNFTVPNFEIVVSNEIDSIEVRWLIPQSNPDFTFYVELDDGTGITKYALCERGCNCEIDTDLHLHFHCNNCGDTVCLTDHKIPQIKVPFGYVSENINLVVKGICNRCSGL